MDLEILIDVEINLRLICSRKCWCRLIFEIICYLAKNLIHALNVLVWIVA